MTDAELDQSYTAVCEALTRVGEAGAPMFLSMLCLSLISRFGRAEQVLPLIENALAQSDAGET